MCSRSYTRTLRNRNPATACTGGKRSAARCNSSHVAEASPNAALIELLDAVKAALPDEVARRRWGRGLDYFRDRAVQEGPRRSVLVFDILDFLNDKHGLKRAPGPRPGDLNVAVQRLDEECERIVRDEPVVAFTFGIFDGGRSLQGPQVNDFVDKLRKLDVAGADLSINVIFKLAGAISQPDWSGVHGGRLHPQRRGMVINAAPPAGLVGHDLERFLIGAMEEAVACAERSLKRHRLAWSTAPHRKILENLQRP